MGQSFKAPRIRLQQLALHWVVQRHDAGGTALRGRGLPDSPRTFEAYRRKCRHQLVQLTVYYPWKITDHKPIRYHQQARYATFSRASTLP
jgi:hypothetical protein